MTQKPKIRLRDICVRAVQAVGWLLLRPLLKFFIRYRYHSQIDLKKIKTPVIVIANHFSNLDPVIVGTILPFGSTIYPIYFIAKDTLLTVPILGGFLKLCGAFRAHKKEGYEKSLAEPKKILANGHSIMIFPQGHRYREFRIDQGRTGTAMLALESGRPVLPIAICGVNGFSWKNVFLRRYRVNVVVGESFFLAEKLKVAHAELVDLRMATKVLMREIMELMVAENLLLARKNELLERKTG